MRRGSLSNVHPALRRCWHPVARSADVGTEPTKVWLLGEPLVVARTELAAAGPGEPTASSGLVVLEDRCPHRLAPLSAGRVVGDTIECAYHGWRFEASGTCREIPSLGEGSPLPGKARCGRPHAVLERYGLVFVALEEPLVEVPEIPAFGEPGRERVDLDPFTGRYGAAQLIDNQLDVAHFAYLHRGTFGAGEARRPPAYEVHRDGLGFECALEVPFRAANDPAVASGVHPLLQRRSMRYRYLAPFHVELRLDYPTMGGSAVIVFFAQPETAERATLYVTLLLEQDGGFSADELERRTDFEYRVVGEDLALQERFDALELPLDLVDECHVRVDRASVEYRRVLVELVELVAAPHEHMDLEVVTA